MHTQKHNYAAKSSVRIPTSEKALEPPPYTIEGTAEQAEACQPGRETTWIRNNLDRSYMTEVSKLKSVFEKTDKN